MPSLAPSSDYALVGTDGRNTTGVTLYEACKALRNAALDGKVFDGAHVRRDDRAVAFWCADRLTVRPMGKANAIEAGDILCYIAPLLAS